jgi:hypothetical protein
MFHEKSGEAPVRKSSNLLWYDPIPARLGLAPPLFPLPLTSLFPPRLFSRLQSDAFVSSDTGAAT